MVRKNEIKGGNSYEKVYSGEDTYIKEGDGESYVRGNKEEIKKRIERWTSIEVVAVRKRRLVRENKINGGSGIWWGGELYLDEDELRG